MSLSKAVTIWCDNADCGHWDNYNKPTVKQTLKTARKAGWKVVSNNEHYCYNCNQN